MQLYNRGMQKSETETWHFLQEIWHLLYEIVTGIPLAIRLANHEALLTKERSKDIRNFLKMARQGLNKFCFEQTDDSVKVKNTPNKSRKHNSSSKDVIKGRYKYLCILRSLLSKLVVSEIYASKVTKRKLVLSHTKTTIGKNASLNSSCKLQSTKNPFSWNTHLGLSNP